ncbi:uncharacterized protein EDB91DRAFT_1115738 [Suillus paluster]|uniref:uncharacterized protein n=1 Tax=Suillus paluster TaxID=48578 RepID=UPI001B866350|nr:uncharacterized protein EDB91DRAFT_1115738 [Suillus paluster]KAG1747968.1 hypothetical protein EDB91DRAFT_1115738 [Suillus paluster]
MSSNKRQRTLSNSRLSPPSQSTSLSPETEPMYKSSRQEASGDRHLLCTLPPTCNPPHNRPTPIANSRDLEAHYGKYHAQVCEQKGCGFVFPDARLLELHQTECHDPLSAVRKDRGEKIFACHLVSCPRLFQTPKARRLHLIQAHSYPKEYFFAVTNKGVGGLLKRWGEGASMIRGTWKPRDNKNEQKDSEDDEMVVDEDEDEDSNEGEDEESSSEDEQNGEATPKIRHHQELEEIPITRAVHSPPRRGSGAAQTAADCDVDKLANSINSLSLVPPSIRFGRGGKNGGFVHPEMHNPQVSKFNPHAFGPRGGRGRARIATVVPRAGSHNAQIGAPHSSQSSAEIGAAPRGVPPRGRAGIINVGKGFRGRGRGS